MIGQVLGHYKILENTARLDALRRRIGLPQ
jgi:hypothetical protein